MTPTNLLTEIEGRKTALTIKEVAKLLNVSSETVRRLAQKKQLPSFKVGGSVRFNPASLGYWLRSRDALAAKSSKRQESA
jgi:excisionase family DNA binding protein